MSCAGLAKNRINILGITMPDDYYYAVSFEYCYINKDSSKVWAKNILMVYTTDILETINSGSLSENLIKIVKQARAELEK